MELKGSFEKKKYLRLNSKVEPKKTKRGRMCSSLTSNKTLGEDIKNFLPESVTKLREQSVFTWLDRDMNGSTIKTFSHKGMSENADLFKSSRVSFTTGGQEVLESTYSADSADEEAYDFAEMLLITADERYGTRMALRIVHGAEWAVRALETSLLHGANSDSNPCVLEGFDTCFDTSSDLVREYLQLNVPADLPRIIHKDLFSAHPYCSTYKTL